MEAVIYVRVSTAGQTEGISMEAQEARARAWAVANGYTVAATFMDSGISGKRVGNRPGLQQALRAVCASRGSALIAYSLSRLARSTRDAIAIAERLQKAGADLVSLTERIDTTTAAGKMMFRMLAVLAEFERDLVSERTKAALAHKASRGERIGGVPFGYRVAADGVKLLRDEAEMATLAQLREMRGTGMSWRTIADTLNTRGTLTKTGRRWSWQTCRKVAAA